MTSWYPVRAERPPHIGHSNATPGNTCGYGTIYRLTTGRRLCSSSKATHLITSMYPVASISASSPIRMAVYFTFQK